MSPLWNLLKLDQNSYWKMLLLNGMVKALWKSLKITIKSIKIEAQLDISTMCSLGIKNQQTSYLGLGHPKPYSNKEGLIG